MKTCFVLYYTHQYGVPMKESLLCSVLVFLADTPKSAGRHVIQSKPEISQRNTTYHLFSTHKNQASTKWKTVPSSGTATNLVSPWNEHKITAQKNICCYSTHHYAWWHHAFFGLYESNSSSVSRHADAQTPLCVLCHWTNCLLCVIPLSSSSDSYPSKQTTILHLLSTHFTYQVE